VAGLTTAAVVLAAGGGSRFRGPTPKLLAPFRGRPLVTWAVAAAVAAGLDETVVVAGGTDLSEVVDGGVTLLVNHSWESGMASSLQVGLAWAGRRGHQAVVVGLGDQPLVPAAAWTAVAGSDCPVAVATFGGQRRPPTRLDRSIWHLLPPGGDEGARVLMARQPELVCEVACDGDPVDVDTVEDLARWS